MRCLRCAVVLVTVTSSLLLPVDAIAGGWGRAKFTNEGGRAAQGCAAKFTEDTYVCLFVRCDAPGELGLYITAPGPDVSGALKFVVDEKTETTRLAPPAG